MKRHNVVNAIRSAVNALNENGCNYEIYDSDYDRLYTFLDFINPNYPTDSIDVIDMMNVLVNNYPLPSTEALKFIKSILAEAEISNRFGELYFRYYHPKLEAVFSYENESKTAVISFEQVKTATSSGKLPLGLPLLITFTKYKDVEDIDNHYHECMLKQYPDDEESFCTCNVSDEQVNKMRFKSRDEFKHYAAKWLYNMKYQKFVPRLDIEIEPKNIL